MRMAGSKQVVRGCSGTLGGEALCINSKRETHRKAEAVIPGMAVGWAEVLNTK